MLTLLTDPEPERPHKAAAAQIGKAPPGRHYPVYIGAYSGAEDLLLNSTGNDGCVTGPSLTDIRVLALILNKSTLDPRQGGKQLN